MEKFSNLFYYRRSTWIVATTRIRYISHKGARAIDGGTEGPITDRGMRGVSRKMIPRVTLSGYTDRPRCSDYKPCSAWYATLHSIPHPWEPLTVPLVYQGNRVAFLASPPPPSLSLSLLSCPRFALPSFSSSFLLLFLHSLLYFSLLFFGDEVLWSRSRVRRARKRNTVETSCNFLATMRTRRFKLCPSLSLSRFRDPRKKMLEGEESFAKLVGRWWTENVRRYERVFVRWLECLESSCLGILRRKLDGIWSTGRVMKFKVGGMFNSCSVLVFFSSLSSFFFYFITLLPPSLSSSPVLLLHVTPMNTTGCKRNWEKLFTQKCSTISFRMKYAWKIWENG